MIFDKFEPFKEVQKQDFAFYATRYETWIGGKIISSGKTNAIINAKVVHIDGKERVQVLCSDSNLINELADKNIFDEFITATDRLQLIIIPVETNIENVGITMFKTIIGATRSNKNFTRNEPYCCNIFMLDKKISKITFSYSNPEKLLEFYYDEDNESLDLDFIFHSSDHIRYENGRQISGPHGGAPRALKVEANVNGGKGYTVTMFNTDGGRSTIQMTPKQMELISNEDKKIQLRGYGNDSMGFSFSDYGLTIFHDNGNLVKCILHMYDRNVDIEYLQ